MKVKAIRLACLTFALLALGACNNDEFFELTNPVESPWQNITDFEKSAIGAYYALSGNAGFRTIFAAGPLAGELYADGVALASPSEGFNINPDAEDMYNRVTGENIPMYDNAVWRSAYFAIGHANGALDFLEEKGGVPFPEAGLNATDRIEGELRFVRAYAYYWLVRCFAPPFPSDEKVLPFRTSQPNDFEEAKTSEVASANDVYNLIVEDLTRAKQLLPERYNASIHPAGYADGRVNRFGAAALLAKVYFHMGRYDESLQELNFVIDQNGGDYDLSEDPIQTWNKTGVARGKETIWYYALWAGDGLGGSSNWKHPRRFEWYNALNQNGNTADRNGGRFIRASDAFLTAAGWADQSGNETPEARQDKRYAQLYLRFGAGADPRSQFTTTRPYVWNNKYYRGGDRRTNLPLLRLADMYLLRAIIRADLGSNRNFDGARADLNAVRARAGLDAFKGTDAELAQAIHLERFKEMAFEGDRLFYLQGARLPIPSGDRGGSEAPWNSPFYSTIPSFEIDFNDAF